MNRVFVDTSGFYAALNRRDTHHRDAVSFAVMERLDLQEAIAFDDHFRQYGAFTIL